VARALLAGRRDAGGGLTLVALDVDPEASRSYTTPGQYVEVKVDKGNGYFVLAGDVAAPRWELVVRNAGDAADALTSAPIGSAIEISAALGLGFPIDAAVGRPLGVAVVGTALAVARPILRRRIAEGDARRTYVFLGVRSAGDVPLVAEVDAWSVEGARVTLCLSRPAAPEDARLLSRATRRQSYVQRAVVHAIEAGELPEGALVVAAGPEEMLADMRALSSAVEIVTNV
jgi:NAD(P)H-flavin reductase